MTRRAYSRTSSPAAVRRRPSPSVALEGGVLASLAVMMMLVVPSAEARPAPPSWPANPHWQRYVEAPTTNLVEPVRVLRTAGDVQHASALLRGHHGAAILTRSTRTSPAPVVVLDLGRDVGGYPSITTTGASGTQVARVAFSETLAHLSPTGDETNTGTLKTGDPHRYDDFPLRGPGTQTSPYVQGAERYLRLTLTRPGRATISAMRIRFSPLRATTRRMRGWFASSDRLLNRIWYAGVYTASLDQLQPHTINNNPTTSNDVPLLLDGAKRDRLVWGGDLLLTDPTLFYALDPTPVRESLRLIARHPAASAAFPQPAVGDLHTPGPIAGACAPWTLAAQLCLGYSASYSMLFVPELYDYVLHTADRRFLRQTWPLITRQMAWDAQQVDRRGLFATNTEDGHDWAVDVHAGEGTYVNGVYVLALTDAARLATLLGHHTLAHMYRGRAASISRAVNRRLWNPRLGAYDASITDQGFVAQDANVYAILSGIASPRRSAVLLTTLGRRLSGHYGPRSVSSDASRRYTRVISPYMAGSQLRALFAHQHTTQALELIRREWGWMVSHDPTGVDWEKIRADGGLTTGDSAAHGWSTGATSALSAEVLGVRPTTPGYTRFSIIPHFGDLRWAQGEVPTPHGPITIRWAHRRCAGTRLAVTVPPGTTGTIVLPRLTRPRTVRPGPHWLVILTPCRRFR